MGYFFGCGCAGAGSGGGGGGTAGKYLSIALSAGASNNFNPGSGWPDSYGRLDLVLAGDATLNSLVKGGDGQEIILRNNSAHTLTIPVAGGGTAANEFTGGGGGTILPPLTAQLICYYAGSINRWVIVS